MTDTDKFRHWVSWLRKHFPSRIPVRVRLGRSALPVDQHGACSYSDEKGRAVIIVADTLNELQTRETLWEEWAHLLRFHLDGVGDSEGHDEIYGAIANMLKRKWVDEE